MDQPKRLIAVTMGDPAGIGPEICLKAIADTKFQQIVPILFGDTKLLRRLSQRCRLALPESAGTLDAATEIARTGTPVILDLPVMKGDVTPTQVSASTGAASYAYITTAIEAALAGKVAGVCTGPIHKEALHAAGVPFPGHTEIFAALTKSKRACMMLTSDALTCSFVTTHVGYDEVPGLLSVDRVFDVIELTHDALTKMKRRQPTLAICGLNPHAGEHGLFGNGEEEQFIIPAVERARLRGILIEGPLPPDTAFLPARRQTTDAFVCLYHDQGHIPLKALAFDKAVNTTLGLPIVRTSVDHGTALDIAWQGKADPTSMLEALRLAEQLCDDNPVEVSDSR